jgi:hypothetical protein
MHRHRFSQRHIKRCPGQLELPYNLGIALVQKGLVDEAIAQFKEVRFKPDDPDAKEWLRAPGVPVPE